MRKENLLPKIVIETLKLYMFGWFVIPMQRYYYYSTLEKRLESNWFLYFFGKFQRKTLLS